MKKIIWFDDLIIEHCLMVQSTKHCIFTVLFLQNETSLIRFLGPITLEKVAPDLGLDKEITHLCKFNDNYMIAGDNQGCVSFINTQTK